MSTDEFNGVNMRVAVVGSGYVGLVAGACFAELGHQVVLVDNDQDKVKLLRNGGIPIHELHLAELIEKFHGTDHLVFTTSLAEAVRSCSVIFIAVGTPPLSNGEADLSYIEEVARAIAQNLDEYKVVVEKSTVPVLTHDWIRRVMRLNGAQDESFDVVSNPEFVREGTAVTDFLYPDRIVIGADSDRSAALLRELYHPVVSGEYRRRVEKVPVPADAQHSARLIVTGAKSAELIKHASNSFLAMKISFVNAVANVCEAVGADIQEVCEGLGSDCRIGSRFLNAGIGFGGSCFPKDLKAFRAVARDSGCEFGLLDEVIKINREQRQRFVRKLRNALWTLKGKRVAALGLAFKGGTDDIRESPAIDVIELLLNEGVTVVAYDPAAMDRAKEVMADRITYAESPYDACMGADALLLLTEWPEFSELDLVRLRSALKYPIVVDGRNLFDPGQMADLGFQYHSVGRPVASGLFAGASVSSREGAEAPSPSDLSALVFSPTHTP